jgi:hypothetical protein
MVRFPALMHLTAASRPQVIPGRYRMVKGERPSG